MRLPYSYISIEGFGYNVEVSIVLLIAALVVIVYTILIVFKIYYGIMGIPKRFINAFTSTPFELISNLLIAIKQKNHERAVKIYEKLSPFLPKDAGVLLQFETTSLLNFDEAKPKLIALLDNDQKKELLLDEVIRYASRNKRWEFIADYYEDIIEYAPKCIRDLLHALLELEKYSDALDLLEGPAFRLFDIEYRFKMTAEINYRLAKLAYASNNLEESQLYLKKSIKADNESSQAKKLYVQLMIKQYRFEDAIKTMIALFADCPEFVFNVFLRIHQALDIKLIKVLISALEEYKNKEELMLIKAIHHLENKEFSQALLHIKQALNISDNLEYITFAEFLMIEYSLNAEENLEKAKYWSTKLKSDLSRRKQQELF